MHKEMDNNMMVHRRPHQPQELQRRRGRTLDKLSITALEQILEVPHKHRAHQRMVLLLLLRQATAFLVSSRRNRLSSNRLDIRRQAIHSRLHTVTRTHNQLHNSQHTVNPSNTIPKQDTKPRLKVVSLV